jgi:hypothetical protein
MGDAADAGDGEGWGAEAQDGGLMIEDLQDEQEDEQQQQQEEEEEEAEEEEYVVGEGF